MHTGHGIEIVQTHSKHELTREKKCLPRPRVSRGAGGGGGGGGGSSSLDTSLLCASGYFSFVSLRILFSLLPLNCS